MGRKEKINNLKIILDIKDDSVAEKYLTRTNWDENEAIELYFNENKIVESNDNKPKKPRAKNEFEITKTLSSTQEVFLQQDKDIFMDTFKFLKEKFYVAQNFKDFYSSLKKYAGLIIIFPRFKSSEVRNNMIRAYNNGVCLDILKQARIFPVLTESKTANEFVKQLSPKEYPLYIFCKYKTPQIMIISAKVEKKFRMDNVINNLLDSFPDNSVKQSIYKSINVSIINFKKKQDKPDNEFDGDEKEVKNLIQKLEKDVNQMDNTIFIRNNINQQEEYNDNPFNRKDDDEMQINNAKQTKNRFQDMFDNDDATILIKNFKIEDKNPISDPNPKVNQNQNNNQFNFESFRDPNLKFDNQIEQKIILPKEPDEKDPNACTITFRCPNVEKHLKRRFNKNDKIEALYMYIQSLGREIYTKPNYNNFELSYGFPPIDFETKKGFTLLEQGLFPSSTINIVEK